MNPTLLGGGFSFGEGPRWFEGLLWFSDMLGEAVHTVDLTGATTTLPLPGCAPSGLGFRPNGTLLIVSTADRRVLRYDGDDVTEVADLSGVTPAHLGDMVVDDRGRAYVGSQARTGGVIVRIDPDDTVTVVADDLDFPNGMVVTPDGGTLVVAESTARRLTSFRVDADGGLTDRTTLAEGMAGPPDGLAIDGRGGVWAALTLAERFERYADDGTGVYEVTDRIDVTGRAAIACALGGPEGRVLFLLSSPGAYPERLVGTTDSRVDVVLADVPAPGVHHH